jgi:hypothetical protein
MKTYLFNKEINNRWYIDIPEWEGDQSELEMVEGADILLDLLSNGKDKVYVDLDDKPFEGADVLTKIEDDREGAYYKVYSINNKSYNMTIWLCEVTLFVFNRLPDEIYVKA